MLREVPAGAEEETEEAVWNCRTEVNTQMNPLLTGQRPFHRPRTKGRCVCFILLLCFNTCTVGWLVTCTRVPPVAAGEQWASLLLSLQLADEWTVLSFVDQLQGWQTKTKFEQFIRSHISSELTKELNQRKSPDFCCGLQDIFLSSANSVLAHHAQTSRWCLFILCDRCLVILLVKYCQQSAGHSGSAF